MTEPTITIWGAARTVTGSMHLVEACGKKILLDCGQSRGLKNETSAKIDFPFEPGRIDAVVLSHAHSDHCGFLPALVRQRFDGPIYCTAPTRDLTEVMLQDSARIQEERAILSSAAGRRDVGDIVPFSREDVFQTIDQCVPIDYGQTVRLGGIEFHLADAGHLLGSAMVAMTIDHAERPRRLTFTGDLGRRGMPLHGTPAPIPPADLLVCESTYGGRTHDTIERTTELLLEIIRRTSERGGKTLIPAFSLGRTQLVAHVLQSAMKEGRLERWPMFVDSPLGLRIVDVYREYPEHLPGGDGQAFLSEPEVAFVQSGEASREVVHLPGPAIIIASSGMCEAGRILHHIAANIDDPRASIVLISFQAPLTLGSRLKEKVPKVWFDGKHWNKWAEVYDLSGFSGHADRNDFRDLLGPLAPDIGKIRLVHGEPEQGEALARQLADQGFPDVELAERSLPIPI